MIMPEPISSNDKVSLSIPTTDDDLVGLATVRDLAFAEKRGILSSHEDSLENEIETYQKYAKHYPKKLQHCRIAKDKETGEIVGAIQLMMRGDPGDLSSPYILRHHLSWGECYIEWIGCHPNHTGKGIGSLLLQWAEEYARQQKAIRLLSLEVMASNVGAIRLYEKKGFIIKQHPQYNTCDKFVGGFIIFCCLGCHYFYDCYMEKSFKESFFTSSKLEDKVPSESIIVSTSQKLNESIPPFTSPTTTTTTTGNSNMTTQNMVEESSSISINVK